MKNPSLCFVAVVVPALAWVCAAFAFTAKAAAPTGLLVNGVANPLAVEQDSVRFTWGMENDGVRGLSQTAWQIRVASSRERLEQEQGGADFWDSGKVPSAQSASLEYAGKKLPPATRFWWDVRVWDQNGNPGPRSAPARFDTGLAPNDWTARYIWDGTDNINNFAYFRKTFSVAHKPALAKIYVTAHSDYMLYFNGQFLGRGPARTDPWRQGQYNSYDITALVRPGKNVLAAAGHWHGTWLNSGVSGLPAFLLEARLDGVTIGTDASWKVLARTGFIEPDPVFLPIRNINPNRPPRPGANRPEPPGGWITDLDSREFGSETVIVRDGPRNQYVPYGGTVSSGAVGGSGNRTAIRFDARIDPANWQAIDFDDSAWAPATVVDRAEFRLFAQMAPAQNEQAELKPVSIVQKNGAWLVAFDRCINGWPQLTMRANRPGDTVRVEYFQRTAERNPAGWDEYICRGASNAATDKNDASDAATDKNGEAVSSYSPGLPERSGGYPGNQNNNKTNLEEVASPQDSPTRGNLFEVGDVSESPGVATASQPRAIRGNGFAVKTTPPASPPTSPPASPNTYSAPAATPAPHAAPETWRPGFGRHTSFQELKITGYSGTLTTDDIRAIWAYTDADVAGRFRCSNPQLNAIYEMCERSARQNIQQAMISVDANREQSQWTADSWNIGIVLLYNHRNTQVIDKVIRGYAAAQLPNGNFPACVPAQRSRCIPEWSMYWPMLLWEQYLFSGDAALLREMAPRLSRFLDWLAKYKNPDTKLIDPPGWRISEYAGGKMPSGGVNTATNCQYYENLRIAARVYAVLGETAASDAYSRRARETKDAINARLFNAAGNYYLARTDRPEKFPLASAWALRFDIAPETSRAKILAAITAQKEKEPPSIGGYGGDAFYSGLLNSGAGAYVARDIVPRYRPMLQGNRANWETLHGAGEFNHAWTSYPGYLFQKYILGIQPTSGGFATFDIRPETGGLTYAEGAVPTVKGDIVTRWEKTAGGRFTLTLTVPPNTRASIYIPKPDKNFTITESQKTIRVSEEGAFLKCDVEAGQYHFLLSPN